MGIEAGLPALERASEAASAKDICNACSGVCAEVCFNGALQPLADGSCRLVPESCAGCGACIPMCPQGKLRLEGGLIGFVPGRPHRPTPQQE